MKLIDAGTRSRGTAVAAFASGKWLTLQRLNDTQYEARVPVSNPLRLTSLFRCCIPVTVSTVSERRDQSCRSPAGYPGENGQTHYQPGELVNVELTSSLKGNLFLRS